MNAARAWICDRGRIVGAQNKWPSFIDAHEPDLGYGTCTASVCLADDTGLRHASAPQRATQCVMTKAERAHGAGEDSMGDAEGSSPRSFPKHCPAPRAAAPGEDSSSLLGVPPSPDAARANTSGQR